MNAAVAAPPLELLEARLAPLRARLAAHPLYPGIRTLPALRLFMESHIFAVWDFMSLLKSLQRALTSVDIPWVPTPFPASRRFINEIVLGEESDEYEGEPVSHFELYLRAMERAGADTAPIRTVVSAIGRERDATGAHPAAPSAFLIPESVPPAARQFLAATFRVIREGSLAAQAAAFTFGREDAIPGMFRSLVRDLNRAMDGDLTQFVWYLERHIEVDGDEHGPLARRMVADLCGNNPTLWEEATEAAAAALQARLTLWDGILAQIQTQPTP